MSFASGEGIVEGMRDMRAAYTDYQLVAFLGDLAHHLQVSQVKGLEAADQ
jgi:hypothetical protein